MYTYHLQGSSTHGAVAESPALSGDWGRAGMGLPTQGWVRLCPAGAAQGLQGFTPSPTTISKLQTPSPWRWQAADEIAELVKKWLTGALPEE